jgi:hypothetical protein
MTGDHFANARGYTSYAADAAALRQAGAQAAAEAYVMSQVGIGSPRQVLDRIAERIEVLGPEISLAGCFYYSGMPRDLAHSSLRLFGEKVIPEARRMAATGQLKPVLA